MISAGARHVAAEQLPEVRALLALTSGFGELRFHAERAWSSATFQGARHTIALEFTGPDAILIGEIFVRDLPHHEFAISGKLVADAEVISIERAAGPARTLVTTEMLILEDCRHEH